MNKEGVKKRISDRIDLWVAGKFRALVDDTEMEMRNKGRPVSFKIKLEETKAAAFNNAVLDGKLRNAMRVATDRGGGGMYYPMDKCSKTGKKVIEVLRD